MRKFSRVVFEMIHDDLFTPEPNLSVNHKQLRYTDLFSCRFSVFLFFPFNTLHPSFPLLLFLTHFICWPISASTPTIFHILMYFGPGVM